MAIFNTARLLDVLVRGRIAEPEPAAEFVDELEVQMESTLSGYGTLDRMGLMEARLLQTMAELEAKAAEREARLLQTMAELEAKAAEREARQARHINQAVGILLAGLALAVGLILGFG